MTTGYHVARGFLKDALDGHLLAATCSYFGMGTFDQEPHQHLPPNNASKEEQLEFFEAAASNDAFDAAKQLGSIN